MKLNSVLFKSKQSVNLHCQKQDHMVEECSKQGVRAAVGLEGLEKASEDVSIANCYNFPLFCPTKDGVLESVESDLWASEVGSWLFLHQASFHNLCSGSVCYVPQGPFYTSLDILTAIADD
jgi:hypothetical protein